MLNLFFKAWIVAYALALRAAANGVYQNYQMKVLLKLLKQQVATPVVQMMTPNRKIRLFSDFKVTLNKFLKEKKYPLPKTEATLGGGFYFSKIDLNQTSTVTRR